MATLQRQVLLSSTPVGARIRRSAETDDNELQRSADATRPAAAGWGRIDAGSMLALQRVHGNAMVQRLVADQKSAAIQRDDADQWSNYPNDTPLGSEALDMTGVTLYKMHGPATPLLFNPDYFNRFGRQMLVDFGRMDQNERKAELALSVVTTHKGAGKEALKAVRQAQGSIGKRAKGKGGEFQNEKVEEYLQAVAAARESMNPINDARGDIKLALKAVKTVFTKQEVEKQKEVVNEVEAREKTEQEWVDKQKKSIGWFFDHVKDFVDVTKWKDLAIDGGLYLGQEFVEFALVNEDELEKVQKELSEAKTKLKQLESKVLVAEMDEAKQALENAQGKLERAKKTFLGRLDEVKRMEVSLAEELGQHKDTKGAAAAIEERGNVGQAALVAGQGYNLYVEQAGTYLDRLAKLDGEYAVLFAKLRDVQKDFIRDQGHFEHIDAVAVANRTNLQTIKASVEDSREIAKGELAFLAKGEFMAGYNQIPDALHAALAGRNEPARRKK